ncbi:MAG: EAL domain-containing protein [Sulfurimonadaceae bacterium]|nr:EAL domain-containing protein [Sulfurimonadaceae bacterium]
MQFSDVYALTSSLKVLYVEDEAELRSSTAGLLENYFERVDTAENGQLGLAMYRTRLDEGERYDIVISDIKMPQLNGIEMCSGILDLYDDQSVIFLTAHNDSEYLMDAIQLGITNFLLKPLQMSEFTRTIYQCADSIHTQQQQRVQQARDKERFDRRERYQLALQVWSQVDYDNVDASIRKATELSAETLEVGRVSLWLYNEEEQTFVCHDSYSRSDKTHESGMLLSADQIDPSYIRHIEAGKLLVIKDFRSNPENSYLIEQYMGDRDVISALVSPINHEGRLLGVIVHGHQHEPRSWRIDEQNFSLMIANNIALSLEIKQRKEIQKQLNEQKAILHHQAHHDRLTGLPNRMLFGDRLDQAIKQGKRTKTKVAVAFIDLDRFKSINDSLGHSTGDLVLKSVAKRLKSHLRECDTLARIGGDEFTLIIEGLHDSDSVIDIIRKLLESMEAPIEVDGQQLYMTLSIGVTIFPHDGVSVEQLLKNADAAMYKAKDEGKNTYQFYTYDMTRKAIDKIKLEIDFRKALAADEFTVYYQPKMNGITDTIIGMEGLVRWERTDGEIVPPSAFIPMAEETGLIIDLDRRVMQMALKQLACWYESGLQPGRLSLNLSMKQLQTSDIVTYIRSTLDETGCQAEWLQLEVTEGQIMKDPEKAIKTLQQIRELGITISIDDFGTGYSSLSYLKRLPIDKLKIDRSFVQELPHDEEDAAISKAVIALAKSLNLDVIAEGVETYEQKEFLVQNGCHLIQGYYYERPIPSNAMELMLEKFAAMQAGVIEPLHFEI